MKTIDVIIKVTNLFWLFVIEATIMMIVGFYF